MVRSNACWAKAVLLSKVMDLTEAGHWEGDLIICKRTRPVLILHERKSRVTLAARLAPPSAVLPGHISVQIGHPAMGDAILDPISRRPRSAGTRHLCPT
jgi:hypothetical protein